MFLIGIIHLAHNISDAMPCQVHHLRMLSGHLILLTGKISSHIQLKISHIGPAKLCSNKPLSASDPDGQPKWSHGIVGATLCAVPSI